MHAIIAKSLIITVCLVPTILNGQLTEVIYETQDILNMQDDIFDEVYDFRESKKLQQSFVLNPNDVNITSAKIEFLFLSPHSFPGDQTSNIKLNFYEGNLENLGALIYSQPYEPQTIPDEAGFDLPFDYESVWSPKIYLITGDLNLETGKSYVFEIEVPDEVTSTYFGFETSSFELGESNRGPNDIWMNMYGEVNSKMDTSIVVSQNENSNLYLDKESKRFPVKMLNKFESANLIVENSNIGQLRYQASDSTILEVEIVTNSEEVDDEIKITGFKEGDGIIYILNQEDTVSLIEVKISERKILPISYQYIKYPGESDHSFQSAFDNINQRVKQIFSPANFYLNFTDQGSIEYEWDLNNDGISYTQSRIEFDSCAAQIPNENKYFSNLFVVRENKDDDDFGGSDGGGSSIGFGSKDLAPRFGFVAIHLFRTENSIAETLSHELGHNLGLTHYSSQNYIFHQIPNDFQNLMKTGRTSNNIFGFQWKVMHKTIKTLATKGEVYESRPVPSIENFEDISLMIDSPSYLLEAGTNSDAGMIFRLSNGKDVIDLDGKGNITVLGHGKAEITAYLYATDNFQSISKTIEVQVLKPCQTTTASIVASACEMYVSPGGYAYNKSGYYLDTIINIGGCDSIINIDLTIDTLNLSISTSENIITGDQVGAKYQWLDCNDNFAKIPGATDLAYSNDKGGDYALEINFNSCLDTTECVSILNVGLEQLEVGDKFTINPNPMLGNGVLFFENIQKNVFVSIISIHGKLISKAFFSEAQKIELNIPGKNGLYLVILSTDNINPTSYKVVKI